MCDELKCEWNVHEEYEITCDQLRCECKGLMAGMRCEMS